MVYQLLATTGLHLWDWVVLGLFLAVILAVGLSYTRQSGKNITQFFLGGRNLPWYLAGISMVATTFAADTPLAVTELVAKNGIAGNWLWWNMLLGGMLTTFFFAKLWRKAGVLTEVEMIHLRYSGKPARFLRIFKSLYLGLFINVLIIGWVNLAMVTILEVFFGISWSTALWVTIGLSGIVALYASLSGLLGVAVTDAIQFVIAIAGCIILAVLVVDSEAIGGLEGLVSQLNTKAPGSLSFFPDMGRGVGEAAIGTTLSLGLGAFIAHLGLQWWASWYPGAEPGGGGYVAQRMLSAKNEKHAVGATLLFQVAHYCIRPWPWIIVALCSVVLYSEIAPAVQNDTLKQRVEAASQLDGVDASLLYSSPEAIQSAARSNKSVAAHEAELIEISQGLQEEARNNPNLADRLAFNQDTRKGFVLVMQDYLPIGLKGLLLAAFLAAFMSTISTQLNWGASYLVNDFVLPLWPGRLSEKQEVAVSRLATVLLMLVGAGVTSVIQSISGVWQFLIECGAGLGLVLILRWYWWRINAWSEIAATVAPFIGYAVGRYVLGLEFPNSFFLTIGFTTVVWLLATFLTRPTDSETLNAFYQKVRPGGWWRPVRPHSEVEADSASLPWLFLGWLLAVVGTYCLLFFIGKLLFQEWTMALLYGTISAMSIAGLVLVLKRTRLFSDGSESVMKPDEGVFDQ